MKRFVIDCSVVMSRCFEDEAGKHTDSVLDMLASAKAVVPSIWALEVANVLLVGERRNTLREADTARFIELLHELPISVDNETCEHALKEILSIGREQGLSSYDAAYLELAMRHGLALATRDKFLRKAAKKFGVKVIQ